MYHNSSNYNRFAASSSYYFCFGPRVIIIVGAEFWPNMAGKFSKLCRKRRVHFTKVFLVAKPRSSTLPRQSLVLNLYICVKFNIIYFDFSIWFFFVHVLIWSGCNLDLKFSGGRYQYEFSVWYWYWYEAVVVLHPRNIS